MRDAVLAKVPAEQDEVTALGVPGREVDEAAIEILHLHTCLLELCDDEPDLARHGLDGVLCVLHVLGIEPAAVARHLASNGRQPLALDDELLARGHEAAHQRFDDDQRVVRFVLAEEAHTC